MSQQHGAAIRAAAQARSCATIKQFMKAATKETA